MSDNVASFPQDDDNANEAAYAAPVKEEPKDVGGVAGQRLRSFIERIENLEEEKKALQEDIKEVYAEAKSTGFCVKTIRSLISLRKKKPEERNELEELLDLYKTAIGML